MKLVLLTLFLLNLFINLVFTQGTCPTVSCQNGGTCNTITGQCICPFNYTGTFCEAAVTSCNSKFCNYNGICLLNSYNQILCTCNSGYTGTYCETVITDCYSTICQNNGVCVSNGNCLCPLLYNGSRCENFIGCLANDPNACSKKGNCINGTCFCSYLYTGKFCDTYMGGCLLSTCQNGGYCPITGICECPVGYSGTYCENATTTQSALNVELIIGLCVGISVPLVLAIFVTFFFVFHFYGNKIKKYMSEKKIIKQSKESEKITVKDSKDSMFVESRNEDEDEHYLNPRNINQQHTDYLLIY